MAVTCPYCGEPNTKMGLRGHITISEDDEHGPLGQIPDDFDETEAGKEVAEYEDQRRAMFQTAGGDGREESEDKSLLGRIFGR